MLVESEYIHDFPEQAAYHNYCAHALKMSHRDPETLKIGPYRLIFYKAKGNRETQKAIVKRILDKREQKEIYGAEIVSAAHQHEPYLGMEGTQYGRARNEWIKKMDELRNPHDEAFSENECTDLVPTTCKEERVNSARIQFSHLQDQYDKQILQQARYLMPNFENPMGIDAKIHDYGNALIILEDDMKTARDQQNHYLPFDIQHHQFHSPIITNHAKKEGTWIQLRGYRRTWNSKFLFLSITKNEENYLEVNSFLAGVQTPVQSTGKNYWGFLKQPKKNQWTWKLVTEDGEQKLEKTHINGTYRQVYNKSAFQKIGDNPRNYKNDLFKYLFQRGSLKVDNMVLDLHLVLPNP